MTSPRTEPVPRGFELALAGTGTLWAFAAESIAHKAAHGLAGRTGLPVLEDLVAALCVIFLLVFGFQLLDWIATRRGELQAALLLPKRSGWPNELGLGAALGWGVGLAAVLPILLSGNLHGRLTTVWRHPGQLVTAVLALAAGALAQELVFRGYVFGRLVSALGPSWAAVVTSLAFSLYLAWGTQSAHLVFTLVDGALLGLLLAIAYLRTHGLWIGWGLHFAYRTLLLLAVGLPLEGSTGWITVLNTYTTGPLWLTGGDFGLGAALFTAPVFLLAMAVLYRSTRDYAWHYTFRSIVGQGYEVVVPPPKAHAAMEKAEATPLLVQILPSTPRNPSVKPEPSEEHTPSSNFHR